MHERGLTDATRVPILIRSVAVAAAVNVGSAPNHGPSLNGTRHDHPLRYGGHSAARFVAQDKIVPVEVRGVRVRRRPPVVIRTVRRSQFTR
jgi:hypothetical protein